MISKKTILNLVPANFEKKALEIFAYQAVHNPVYAEFLSVLKINSKNIQTLTEIPFLPISLFKSHKIITGNIPAQITFASSGTTGLTISRHHVVDPAFYLDITKTIFNHFYGPVANYCVLALLPAYLERQGSSLVYMVEEFIKVSKYPESGFYLDDLAKISTQLAKNQAAKIPTLLIGVSFALLDLVEQFPQDLSSIMVMETGGMKGRRKEITRDELHAILQNGFNLPAVHSEYGMTELLSQAYSTGNGWFKGGPTFRALVREITDPFAYVSSGRTGLLNIIDLANVDSCSFIATDDLGQLSADGAFRVIGRLDASDIRGCNLMVGG